MHCQVGFATISQESVFFCQVDHKNSHGDTAFLQVDTRTDKININISGTVLFMFRVPAKVLIKIKKLLTQQL